LAGPAAGHRLEGRHRLRHARRVRACLVPLIRPPAPGASFLNRTSPLASALSLLAATAAAPLAAQEIAARPATADACLAISSSAQRLACYDAAMGYVAPTPQEADLAAAAAEQLEQAATVQAVDADPAVSERVAELFTRDLAGEPDTRAAIANSGRGSLLDSRWELAKDSKLGIFQLR